MQDKALYNLALKVKSDCRKGDEDPQDAANVIGRMIDAVQEAEAQVTAMRPVVEAAVLWTALKPESSDAWYALKDLRGAIDAYRAATTTKGATPDASE